MKKFLVVLSILAAISLPSLANGLADKPTVDFCALWVTIVGLIGAAILIEKLKK